MTISEQFLNIFSKIGINTKKLLHLVYKSKVDAFYSRHSSSPNIVKILLLDIHMPIGVKLSSLSKYNSLNEDEEYRWAVYLV